jgi:hypothetical protein
MKISPAENCMSPIILLYGGEGRGKTTLAAKFPNPLFMLLERGLPRGVTVDAIEDTDSFEGVLRALGHIYNEGPGDYRTLVIDTTDMLEAHIIEYVCAKHNWKTIEQPSYGKGWIACDDEWRRFIRAINAIRDRHVMTVVLVAHSTIERIDDPRTPTYTSYQPKLHKRARALVMDASDIIGFLSEDLRVVTDDSGFHERVRATAGNGRFLFVEGRPAFAAKNRYGMPEKLPIPLDFNIETLTQNWRFEK